MNVSTPFGFLGAVLQGEELCSPHYSLVNWTGAEIFNIHHPEFVHKTRCRCCNEGVFEATEYFVYTATTDFDPTKVGTIARHLPRQLKEKDGIMENEDAKRLFNKSEDQCCGITFPAELDIQSKLLLLGALFVLVIYNNIFRHFHYI